MIAWLIPDKLILRPPTPSYKGDSSVLHLPTSDGGTIAARFYENETAAHTILFSHGNAEDIGHLEIFAKQLRDQGFAVLTFDYRGYGLSDGSPTENKTYKDIDAAYDYLVNDRTIPAERIILHGRSLGGGVAVDLAGRVLVGGLILESTFTSAARVLTRVKVLPFDKFDNLSKIALVSCPVLVIHGRRDKTIPIHHGETLYAAAKEPKSHLWIENAGHNDLFYTAGETYLLAIQNFSKTLQ